jgi:hypothetical protein
MNICAKARRDWGYRNPSFFDTELGCDVKIVDGIRYRLVEWGAVHCWTPVDKKSHNLGQPPE